MHITIDKLVDLDSFASNHTSAMSFKGPFWLLKNERIIAFIFFLFINLFVYKTCLCQSYPYKFKYLTVDEGLSHTDANYIAQDNKGYLWIATNFGLDRYDGYVIKKYYNDNVPIDNARKNRIKGSFPDETGRIWLATEGGLQCFDPSNEKYLDFTATGKESNPVFSKIIKLNNLIYGIVENKLEVYSIKGLSLIKQQIALPNGLSFFDMATDQHGTIYLATSRGRWYLAKNKTIHQVNITGFSERKIDNICFDRRGQLLFASANQVILTKHNGY